LLRDAGQKEPRWRQVDHPLAGGGDLPVLYSAIRIGQNGTVVALGRNLRDVASLQQRLVEAQQSVEREYARLRSAETRYRLLLQITREPVLIVEATGRQIVEANPAAERLFLNQAKKPRKKLVGRALAEVARQFDAAGRKALDSLLATVAELGRGDDLQLHAAEGGATFYVTVTLFRQGSSVYFLVRFAPLSEDSAAAALPPARSRLLDVVEAAPDAFVITTPQGDILTANRAFLDLAQLATEAQAKDQPLDRWLGRPGVDWSVLRANLREHHVIRLFASTLQGELGAVTEIEISAVAVPEGEMPCYGFMIRSVGQRLKADATASVLPQSVEDLTELVGRVSLKEIVRETTDVIEQLCIEAALKLTGDNRASAAEMLGVSRQSLYVKMRRHGMSDLAPESEP
jgi:transcriptional regulator PpsR